MAPLDPWPVYAAAVVLTLCLVLGLKLISAKRFAQIVAGGGAGLVLGLAFSRLSFGGGHG